MSSDLNPKQTMKILKSLGTKATVTMNWHKSGLTKWSGKVLGLVMNPWYTGTQESSSSQAFFLVSRV